MYFNSEASGSFAENQKITAIRKVYQKGVMNPMINVDQLWKDYCAFENVKHFKKRMFNIVLLIFYLN